VGREGLLALLAECRGRGTTVLLSSHVLSDVERLCDRVAVLGAGRLAAAGTLDEVLTLRGRTALEVEGGDDALRAAREALERAGGRVVASGPAREPLERVFLRLLGKDRGSPRDGPRGGDGNGGADGTADAGTGGA
jgi:ABC-type multidrug transport system ATPase subunit